MSEIKQFEPKFMPIGVLTRADVLEWLAHD